MAKWPNWREVKKTLDDPEKREELRANLQRGAEKGRDTASKRLAGPAAHLRSVGAQFKSALNEDDDARPDAAPGSAPGSGEPQAGPPAQP